MPTFTYIPARMILSVTDLMWLSPDEISLVDQLPPYRVAIWPNRKGIVTYPLERAEILARIAQARTARTRPVSA